MFAIKFGQIELKIGTQVKVNELKEFSQSYSCNLRLKILEQSDFIIFWVWIKKMYDLRIWNWVEHSFLYYFKYPQSFLYEKTEVEGKYFFLI